VKELRHSIRVRYSDCDPQGVLFNANYLTYFDIGLTELWRETLGPYDVVMGERGVDLVVAEATVRYRAPIRFDEVVEVVIGVMRLGNTSLLTGLRIEAAGGLAAEGELRHVFVRYGTNETTPMPDDVREALSSYLIDGDRGSLAP
jgi:acyl-CoA thioester hydrolase